jgi:hypothetical protein
MNNKRRRRKEKECPMCNAIFETGQALGGHMSRSHPGQSDTYNRKLEKR